MYGVRVGNVPDGGMHEDGRPGLRILYNNRELQLGPELYGLHRLTMHHLCNRLLHPGRGGRYVRSVCPGTQLRVASLMHEFDNVAMQLVQCRVLSFRRRLR